MRLLNPVGSPVQTAFPAAEFSKENLSSTAEKLFSALQQVAELVKAARGYHFGTTQTTFFAPVESVALAIGVSRQTIYNRLPELVKAGLVAQRGHYCTHNGQTRSDGSLWAVKVLDTPAPAKIDHDWLKGSYRSLAGDIATGRTAWALLQSNPRRNQPVDISYVLTFALPPTKNSLNNDCKGLKAPVLETLIDVPYVPPEGRQKAVQATAEAISSVLSGAKKDINLYRWLVWQLLRLEQQQNKSYFYAVFLMVQRAAVEKRENACRNATGLLISRLKTSGIWQELKGVKHVRVGLSP